MESRDRSSKGPEAPSGRICFHCGIPLRCEVHYSRILGQKRQTRLVVWTCPECEETSYEVTPGLGL